MEGSGGEGGIDSRDVGENKCPLTGTVSGNCFPKVSEEEFSAGRYMECWELRTQLW